MEIRSQCYNHNSNEEKKETERKYQSFHKEWQVQFAGAEQKTKAVSLCEKKKSYKIKQSRDIFSKYIMNVITSLNSQKQSVELVYWNQILHPIKL